MSDNPNDLRVPAVERLALSRERLRISLQEDAKTRIEKRDHPSVVMTALLAIPGAGVLVDSLRSWWSQHPLRLVASVASNMAHGAMRPVARRNPYSLVIAAMAIGGLLFWVKPWRGLLKPALLAGLLPHFISRAMAQVPVEAWVASLVKSASLQRPPKATASSAAPAASAPLTPAAGTPAAATGVEAPASSAPDALPGADAGGLASSPHRSPTTFH